LGYRELKRFCETFGVEIKLPQSVQGFLQRVNTWVSTAS
jgi:hypothetical protein